MLSAPLANEQLAVARVAGRHHAIEHVDAGADTGAQVLGRAHAHQVTRAVVRHLGRDRADHGVHHRRRLADAQAAQRQPVERQLGDLRQVRAAQRHVDAALHDAEAQLAGGARRLDAAARPARGARHRRGHDLERRVRRRTLVERHRDVAAQQRLDLHRAFGRQPLLGAVEVRAEGRAVLVDGAALAQAEDLEAARVGEDRARPGHEAVQAAELAHALGAGAQRQVVGVAEDDARAQPPDVARRQRLHAGLRADRHEDRRLDRPVRGVQHAGARVAVARDDLEDGVAGPLTRRPFR